MADVAADGVARIAKPMKDRSVAGGQRRQPLVGMTGHLAPPGVASAQIFNGSIFEKHPLGDGNGLSRGRQRQ
jgi:hypothetical protein